MPPTELIQPPPGAPHPEVAVDVVALSWCEDRDAPLGAVLRAVVVHSDALHPGGWALPGAYVQPDETVPDTVRRVFAQKIGMGPAASLVHLRPFSEIDRDPRRRTISLPVLALVPNRGVDLDDLAGTWAAVHAADTPAATRIEVDGQPADLLFDHADIIVTALVELRRRLDSDDLAVLAGLLAPEFALREVERLWNAITGRVVNTPAFRRRLTGLLRPGDPPRPWLAPTGRSGAVSSGRPPKLYRWTP